MEIHVVTSGETLYSIAAQYGVSVDRLSVTNEIPVGETLVVGQTIVVLFPELIHTVAAGDTVEGIAAQYGVSTNAIYRNNINLGGRPILYPGQTLVISYTDSPSYTVSVNGYAYPFVSIPLLRQTLPYNTYLSPFTYGITPVGGLVTLDDSALLSVAGEYGTAALMHLSTLTESGSFDSGLATTVLNDENARENLIENVVQNINEKGYAGLDIDFEFVPGENADEYASFIDALRQRLNAEGKIVIAALAPKTFAEQRGLLYEGHDYAAIGAAANYVLLMTYEWGYTYSSPMSVAPIPSVRRVLDYAVTEVPPEKIYLGIPNYGYDWPLPYLKGETMAQSISNVRAVQLARAYGAEIEYSEPEQTPHFSYTARSGIQHEVWFEDARSIRAKLALISEYGLYGAGYWNLMRPFPQNWLVLNSMYNLRRV